MSARRDRSTPYELMGSSIGRAASSRSHREPDRPVDRSHHHANPLVRWWAQSGAGIPILLRIPRGIAVLVVVGLLAGMLLAFWVGTLVAGPDGAPLAGDPPPPRQPPLGWSPPDNNQHQADPVQSRQTSRDQARTGDPRQPGRNYFLLASVYTHAEAHRLSEFLAGHGVETIVVPGNNDRSAVIAVDQGFTGENDPAVAAYRQRLLQAGQAWRRHAPEHRDSLDTMHLVLYRGP